MSFSVTSKGIVGCHPVAFTNFELSPSRIGTSLGRRRAGSWRTSIFAFVMPSRWSSTFWIVHASPLQML